MIVSTSGSPRWDRRSTTCWWRSPSSTSSTSAPASSTTPSSRSPLMWLILNYPLWKSAVDQIHRCSKCTAWPMSTFSPTSGILWRYGLTSCCCKLKFVYVLLLIKVTYDLADFPAVFFYISHWYLSWNNWQTPVTRVIWVGQSTTYDLHSFRTSWCHGQPTWQWVLRWSDTWLSVGCFKIIGKIPFSSSFLSFLAPQVL